MKKPINYAAIEKYIFECIDFSEYQKQPGCFTMDYQQFRVIELMKAFCIPVPKNEYEIYNRWYGQLYDYIKFLISKK